MLTVIDENEKNIIEAAKYHDWTTPRYKLKHFVGNSHIHPMHKVQQYLLEIQTRKDTIESHEYELKKFEAQRDVEIERLERCESPAEKKLLQVEIDELTRKLDVARLKIHRLMLDLKKFIALVDEINNSPEGRDEDGVLYMDILNDTEKKDQIENNYWEYRLAKQAAMDMVAYGRIGVGNMEAIMQLDADSQNKCLAMAYEVLISNEVRMNNIQDAVVQRIHSGVGVSDITKLLNIQQTNFSTQLLNQEKPDVPLIQKR